jgi:hypothetical protein
MMASHISDALGDMLAAAAAIMRGDEESSFSFQEEPQEVRWRLRRIGSERLRVRILRLPDIVRILPDERGEVLLDAECRLRTFAGHVLSVAQRIFAEHGMEGYRKQWSTYEFPLAQMNALEAALRI